MPGVGFAWPRDACGAVSLTFDDGHVTHREKAVPLLEERGLLGTFYLCPKGEEYEGNLPAWREIQDRGHEIGNHTLSHTCSRNLWEAEGVPSLETWTLEGIAEDIDEAESRLDRDLPGPSIRTFCYPCYQTYVGSGRTRQSYVPVVAERFLAARGCGEYGFFNHPVRCDLHCLFSTAGDHCRSTELVGLVESAVSQGQWLILVFHTIGDSRLGTLTFDFVELLDHLALHRERIFVAPLRESAQWVVDRRGEVPGSGEE